MRLQDLWRVGLLGLLLISLLSASTCVKEKTIEFVVNAQSIACFIADGEKNVDLGSDLDVDLKSDVNIREIALDYGVNPDSVRAVSFRGLCAKIDTADVVQGRAVNGELYAKFGSRAEVQIGSVSGFAADAVTDWIDITESVTPEGVAEMNRLLAECLREAQGGAPATDFIVDYRWAGTSTPTDQRTHFSWKVKVVMNIVPTVTGDFPDF